jgi:hypothetical protein
MSTLWLEFWTEDDDFCMYAAIDDAITLNDESLSAKLMGRLKAKIVYFDSCQQGANMTCPGAFQMLRLPG